MVDQISGNIDGWKRGKGDERLTWLFSLAESDPRF